MEIAAVILLAVSAAILFATQALRIDVVAMLILVALALSGLVRPEEALSGFSDPTTATVAAMFILSAALKQTGTIDALAAGLNAATKTRKWLLLPAMLLVSAVVSAFINNTAAVAVFIPVVLGLARSHGKSPGRFLMPLSFAAQAGGVCTLIGTSTNILVSGIAVRNGQPPIGMFELSGLGACLFAATFLYLVTIAPRLLPDEMGTPLTPLAERYQLHSYLAELEVPEDSPYAGKCLAEAQLEKLLDVEVLEIMRGEARRWLPDPDETLEPGDILLVRGPIAELLKTRAHPGLKIRRDRHAEKTTLEGEDVVLVEAVVPPGSALVGRTLKRSQFRRRHRSQVLAIRHHDELQRRKVGQVRLAVGDVLLVQGHRADLAEMREGAELILMEEVSPHVRSWKRTAFALAVITAVVSVAALGFAPILLTAMAGVAALVFGKILTVDQAYEAIDWKVIFLLAGVIPLATAIDQTGGAALMARGMSAVLGSLGPWAVLSVFFLATSVLTQIISNNATAALLAPIAFAVAARAGVSPRPLLVAITVAASTSFMTPIGYQTNAMVMGPGRYRVMDFVRVGTPLNVAIWIMASILIPVFFPFQG